MTSPTVSTDNAPLITEELLFDTMDLLLAHFDRLPLPHLVRELVDLDPDMVSDETASLVAKVLMANGYVGAEPPTYAALRSLLDPQLHQETDTDFLTRRLHAATTAIALGLHQVEDGWILYTLLDAPRDLRAADWFALVHAVEQRMAPAR